MYTKWVTYLTSVFEQVYPSHMYDFKYNMYIFFCFHNNIFITKYIFVPKLYFSTRMKKVHIIRFETPSLPLQVSIRNQNRKSTGICIAADTEIWKHPDDNVENVVQGILSKEFLMEERNLQEICFCFFLWIKKTHGRKNKWAVKLLKKKSWLQLFPLSPFLLLQYFFDRYVYFR